VKKKYCAVFVNERTFPEDRNRFCPDREILCCRFCKKKEVCPRLELKLKTCTASRDQEDCSRCGARITFMNAFWLRVNPAHYEELKRRF